MNRTRSVDSLAAISEKYLESDFPSGVPRPKWLLSAYQADVWLTTGAREGACHKIFFNMLMSDGSLLTDPQHSHLLDTVRRMSIGLRTGPYSTVTDPRVHVAMTHFVVNWVLWMDLNGIRRFANLTPSDLEAYIEKAINGVGCLLDLRVRIRRLLSDANGSGVGLPRRGRFLDIASLLKGKLDWSRVLHDRGSIYELLKQAQEEGLYLLRRQAKILEAGPDFPAGISQVHLRRLLQPWEIQWQMRRTLPGDKLTFDPFPSERLGRIADKLGRVSSRTETVPIHQAMFLIDRSIRWVLDYAPTILDLVERAEAVAQKHPQIRDRRKRIKALENILTDMQLPEGPGQPWPIKLRLTSNFHNDRMGIASVLRRLFASCFVVVAAFTARRHNEVTSCREKGSNHEYCITSDGEGNWIELWIEKSVQGWDKTPCPEIVVSAAEVLRKLSKSARTISGSTDLFQYKLVGLNKPASFRVRKGLGELTSNLDIPSLADGSTWTFNPRQLRRFFAIMYIWRYEFGELSALSYQLRHYNLDMTRRYITEPTQGKIFREVQTQHSVSILKEVGLGRRDGSGPFGERFKKVAEKIRAQMIAMVHVFSEEKFAERIERLILRSGKVLKGFPWGYCTCGSSARDIAQAKCVEGDDVVQAAGPNKANATLLTCATCPHHFTHNAFGPYTAGQIELHEKAAGNTKNGHLIRNASAAYLPRLREYYDRSFCRSKTVRLPHAQQDEDPSSSNCASKSRRRSR